MPFRYMLLTTAGLASFTGMLFRRYSSDLSPLLKYVVHQLYNGQTTEIVVLRELIWKMAGIEPLPSLSDSQIAAMAGGPALRIEAIASTTRGARLDPGDAILKGPQRLGKSLLETFLALPLLIQVAQQRQSCVFKAPDTHLKSLASLFDTVGRASYRARILVSKSLAQFRPTGYYCSTWNCLLLWLLSPLKTMRRGSFLLWPTLGSCTEYLLQFACKLFVQCLTAFSW